MSRASALTVLTAAIACLFAIPFSAAHAQAIHFSPNQIMTWPTRSFSGETHYDIVEKSVHWSTKRFKLY